MKELIEKIVDRLNGEMYIDECGNNVLHGGIISYENKWKYEIGHNRGLSKAISIIQEEAKAYNKSVKGDLISRSALLREVSLEVNFMPCGKDATEMTLRKWIENQPTAYNDEWIPVSSGKLPEEGVDVLVWYEYFRYGNYNCLYQTYGISCTFNEKWCGLVNGSSGWKDLRIIAWQPLPAPYQPKGEKS